MLRSCGTLTVINIKSNSVFQVYGFLCVPHVRSFSLQFYKKKFMFSMNVIIK